MEPTSNSARRREPTMDSQKSSDDYLANQISDARHALESTLEDLTLDLASAADLRRWVRRYPWAALGTALVAGFTVAHFAMRSKRSDNSAGNREPDGRPAAKTVEQFASGQTAKTSSPTEPPGGWRTAMINALFDILRVAVTQFVTASVRQVASRTPRPQSRPSDDGANAEVKRDGPMPSSLGD